ncbi:hypothetical protein [Hymenobacter sp. B81]|uniref:hypothetical protein n=1 Tax=Hymenobacter sp. B81 TaxID=3344878 RepID=UPI0037DD60F3
MEDYAAKMARKTDAELRLYVTNRGEYREDAVLAALTELEQRGHVLPGAADLRAELQVAVAREQAEALRNPPPQPAWMRPAEPEPQEEEAAADTPTLYSPSTVAVFSVLFSFFIGGLLMLLNLLRLRRYGGAALLLALVMPLLALQVWLPAQLGVQPGYSALVINVLTALLYVYVMWPYFIGRQPYRSRGWVMPLIVIFGVVLLLMTLARMSGLPMPGVAP